VREKGNGFRKFIIFGCESRGDKDSAYMTRYVFPRIGPLRATIHVFHRSDADEHHDHPWDFLSIILWRGYIEETACKDCSGYGYHITCEPYGGPLCQEMCEHCDGAGTFGKRVYPGMVLFRRAEHRHRVVLVDGKKAVTLCLMFKRRREWGFFTKQGWQEAMAYFKERGCE
jgi:hypothetical protein